MSSPTSQIEDLDLSLFSHIESQTTPADRRSLLAVQRSVAKIRGSYTYLEIGSHLGGSLQPYLVDPRCTKIFSIDPRPLSQPDDRSPGCVWDYEGNSTQRMLGLLGEIDATAIGKIVCFDQSSTDVDVKAIDPKPHVAFIDGEHTYQAVIKDIDFCLGIMADGGTILFHDTWIVIRAIADAYERLRRTRVDVIGISLGGGVSGLFFDPDVIYKDPFLLKLYQHKKSGFSRDLMKAKLRETLPPALWNVMSKAKAMFGGDRA
jgi:hypothetical protein